MANFIGMEFKHIRSHLFDSNSTAGFSVEPKFLIEFNGNSSEENDDEEKEAINIEFTDQNLIMKTIKMRLILDCRISKEKTSNTIAKVNLINSLIKKTDEKIFPRK